MTRERHAAVTGSVRLPPSLDFACVFAENYCLIKQAGYPFHTGRGPTPTS